MKASAATKVLRCAIYTRKSTEEGLEQAFNSLDAQREACSAYILSQCHEGWQAMPDHYDDGGYSGGSMNRPGLVQLMEDIAAGKVDVIVVYKVDRLTRSLADFAKIIEVLDKHKASFVSVTQAFNTTSSMGRLTLNVLLSFAQFEREVTGERIRDKIAASKARGMWMGGVVPLGYRVDDRKLIVVAEEADRVRHIFRRYLALGSVYALQAELAEQGIRTKTRTGRDGRPMGDAPFSRGALYQMLRNRIYLGDICHKGTAYSGDHDAIVDAALFAQVCALLETNRNDHAAGIQAEHPSLLCGVVWDGEGRRMVPSHSNKKGVRYRYYVSQQDKHRLKLKAWRVPAGDLEAVVIAQLCEHLGTEVGSSGTRDQLRDYVQQVTINMDRITLTIADREESRQVEVPATWIRRGNQRKLLPPAGQPWAGRPDPALVKLVVRGHQARQHLAKAASVAAAAEAMGLNQRYFSVLVKIGFLAPDIQAAILDGHQPLQLNRQRLSRIGNMPSCWQAQRQLLGFA
ncbi:MAG TPA: recombinase family protein [Sphingobium sp.]